MEHRMGKEALKQKCRSTESKPSLSLVLGWMADKARQASPLLVMGLCLALAYKGRKRTRPVLQRSVSMAALLGGRVALQRILDSQEARVNRAALDDAARHLHDLLAQEPLNFAKLQKAAANMEMSGREDEAIDKLRKAWEKAAQGEQPHEAHELQMLLAEMLIYKGDYQQVLECQCLLDKGISDARGPLYKSVVYTIMGNRGRAQECYDEFQSIRSRIYLPDSFEEGSAPHGVVHGFSKFEEVVNNLKIEIEQAQKAKATRAMKTARRKREEVPLCFT